MKLTNLNIDCLECILGYLGLADLLNAADSNKRLCHASKFVYIRKYGSYTHVFETIYKSEQECLKKVNSENPIIVMKNTTNEIYCRYLKHILQLLRNFGRLVYGVEFFMIFIERDREI